MAFVARVTGITVQSEKSFEDALAAGIERGHLRARGWTDGVS